MTVGIGGGGGIRGRRAAADNGRQDGTPASGTREWCRIRWVQSGATRSAAMVIAPGSRYLCSRCPAQTGRDRVDGPMLDHEVAETLCGRGDPNCQAWVGQW